VSFVGVRSGSAGTGELRYGSLSFGLVRQASLGGLGQSRVWQGLARFGRWGQLSWGVSRYVTLRYVEAGSVWLNMVRCGVVIHNENPILISYLLVNMCFR
tara:strand:- start:859 stop:1158 length:300 start_codon:yes stop_codon:yes gene_type:complete